MCMPSFFYGSAVADKHLLTMDVKLRIIRFCSLWLLWLYQNITFSMILHGLAHELLRMAFQRAKCETLSLIALAAYVSTRFNYLGRSHRSSHVSF
jgi:hypothetical protein